MICERGERDAGSASAAYRRLATHPGAGALPGLRPPASARGMRRTPAGTLGLN